MRLWLLSQVFTTLFGLLSLNDVLTSVALAVGRGKGMGLEAAKVTAFVASAAICFGYLALDR
jgi:hypothetical protein